MAMILCPECQNKISDKSDHCIYCGCPRTEFVASMDISSSDEQKSVKTENTKPQRVKKKHMRLPNGYGTIKKLSGNRRNPYAAYPPYTIDEVNDDGVPPTKKAIGYYVTWYDAYDGLTEWHKFPLEKKRMITLGEVYQEYLDRELEGASSAKKYSITSSYKFVEKLKNTPMSQIYANDMQQIVDDAAEKYSQSTIANIKKLFMALSKYAEKNNYIDKNYATYIKGNKGKEIEEGNPFSRDALARIFEVNDDISRVIRILIYTGYRINELYVIEIDLENNLMKGGLKNKNSKERIVPIHPYIRNDIEWWLGFRGQCTYKTLTDKLSKNLEKSNTLYEDGKKHTFHDCRHTFSLLCDTYKVDIVNKHFLMGHAIGKDTEALTYTHRTIKQLRCAIEKIPNFENVKY